MKKQLEEIHHLISITRLIMLFAIFCCPILAVWIDIITAIKIMLSFIIFTMIMWVFQKAIKRVISTIGKDNKPYQSPDKRKEERE